MNKEINFHDFRDAFEKSDNYKNNFSYEGLVTLWEYLEELEEELNEPLTLDIISFCCDYSEVTLEEFNRDYETNYKETDLEDDEKFVRTVEGKNTYIIRNT
jgi:hypothetical protein